MVARVLVRFIAVLIVIAAPVCSGRWAYAEDLPITGSYRFSAAMNQHADHMTGCMHFDPLGAVSGSATSSRIHKNKASHEKSCKVIISGVYLPSMSGAYQATITLIPLNFACHSDRVDNELLHFNIVPYHGALKLNLTRIGKRNTLSGTGTRESVHGPAALLVCS
ncbi:MAG: hypothetical protein ACREQ4_03110 [Candidatus Binataceae bacterium]